MMGKAWTNDKLRLPDKTTESSQIKADEKVGKCLLQRNVLQRILFSRRFVL
jgi:hypothetical protein